MSTLREASRKTWASSNSIESINAGSLQRIADAAERMATHHTELIRQRDHYEAQAKTLGAEVDRLTRQRNSLRGVITRLKRGQPEQQALREGVLRWLAARDGVGLSSKTIAFTAAGIACEVNHPSDPGDFRRCLLLLEKVPGIRERMHLVASKSEEWKALVARWQEIEDLFRSEVGDIRSTGWRAPKTLALIREIIEA